ncbi:siderophore ABC transporter substrate-binding protein [Gephyromycinifex aptenodytis]|uniref:siderophore ABC transporter substrate-binding protein n=1 Tax=Gephyromycinifex aptenodytis TaxID=2716227 RepID=UPI001447BF8A|nr:ABC transporter substrate-binding protein [Gephyromycinifex aptenodytis]
MPVRASVSRRFTALLTVGALSLAMSGCGQENEASPAAAPTAEKVSVTHAQGTTEVVKDPQKIVVLEFGALDTLNSLGMADRVVGVPKTGVVPESLSQFKDDKYTNVGSMFEPDLEAIKKTNPDLVILGFRSAKKYPDLAAHFPTVDVTFADGGTFYEGVEEASTIIGKAVGKEAEVEAKLGELKKTIEDTKTKMPDGTGMILMTSAGKVTQHGEKSRFGAIFRDLGVKSSGQVADNPHGDPISFEAIQKADPDMLFVVDRDAAIGKSGKAAKEVLNNELVASTKAWKNNKVVYLDGQRWYVIMHGLDNAKAMIEGAVEGL